MKQKEKISQKQKVPDLRFPEFKDAREWEEVSGDFLFASITNKNHDSNLPILAITQEYGAIPRHLIDYQISVTEKSIESYKVVEPGDFIISLRSFQGGIEYSNYLGICSPAYIILRKIKPLYDHFYRHFFKTPKYIQGLNKNIEGIRDGKMVSFKQFSELHIPFPAFPEQQKIADCLSLLDEVISLESRKLKSLQSYKKGLLQKLFPAEGETVPELRFPEFQDAGEWEKRKLGEVCVMKAGQFVSATEIKEFFIEGLFPCYGGNGIRGFTKTYTHDGSYSLVGRQGALCGNVNYVKGKFHATEHALVCVPGLGINNLWLYYQLFKMNLNQYATGQAQPGLSVDNLVKISVFSPTNILEQQKIADCLSSLDALIQEQSQKLEGLKSHKQGLLQGLFPVMGE
ncbi:restriction endonuclease subunit S [Leptospira ilyithenensis]|uniref:Restriction endonuclease subunit S n=1 Tax=Leptospira ilyithenensis TaxID=2484901 RepID=A0A4V3JWY2_9LEPT|nr:restriction endonuclease subunit S [Leptospira ilyithenensis]TGN09351.1 restriction endonuclease subunit S [Leptospira ilyithenensis]